MPRIRDFQSNCELIRFRLEDCKHNMIYNRNIWDKFWMYSLQLTKRQNSPIHEQNHFSANVLCNVGGACDCVSLHEHSVHIECLFYFNVCVCVNCMAFSTYNTQHEPETLARERIHRTGIFALTQIHNIILFVHRCSQNILRLCAWQLQRERKKRKHKTEASVSIRRPILKLSHLIEKLKFIRKNQAFICRSSHKIQLTKTLSIFVAFYTQYFDSWRRILFGEFALHSLSLCLSAWRTVWFGVLCAYV